MTITTDRMNGLSEVEVVLHHLAETIVGSSGHRAAERTCANHLLG